MDSKQSYFLGGRHYSQTINQNIYEKINPKTQKLGKIIKVTCSFCGTNKSQTFYRVNGK